MAPDPAPLSVAALPAAMPRRRCLTTESSTALHTARQSPRARPSRAAQVRFFPMRRLVPMAFVLLQAAKAEVEAAGGASGGLGSFGAGLGPSFGPFSQWLNHGPGAGALVIGREDLLRVRTSLGRISDELHLILGVVDQHLEGTASAAAAAAIDDRNIAKHRANVQNFQPLPCEANGTEANEEPSAGVSIAFIWALGEWLFSFGIFGLDIGIVVGLQLFMESIGRKRGGSSIMPKQSLTSALAKASGTAHAPIPAPSGTPGRDSSQRLSVLSQEEFLAACLTEHWGKLAIGATMAVASRLPQHIFDDEGILCHLLFNLSVMLRCMSLVMLLLRDDVALPKREKAAPPAPPALPPSGSTRRRSPSPRPAQLVPAASMTTTDGSG